MTPGEKLASELYSVGSISHGWLSNLIDDLISVERETCACIAEHGANERPSEDGYDRGHRHGRLAAASAIRNQGG